MIKVQDLFYTYPKNPTPTVKGIHFEVAKGESLGFLGPSGAGKSTTQKVLIKLLGQFQGDIQVFGKDLRAWNKSFYEHVGVGFELPNHYPKLTAKENLRFFSSFYQRATLPPMQLLDWVGLAPDADKRVADFSKGMKMRLNFVRALLHQPEILFFDEPTSGLDPVNARILKDLILAQKAAGKTMFITTHNMHDAEELCDRVAFIVEGEIKLIDTPRKLKQMAGERKVVVEYKEKEGLNSQEFPLDGLAGNDGFQQVLQQHDIQSIHSKEASLEDVFIQVTGQSLK